MEVGEGTATFEVEPAVFHFNPIGVVPDGLALALLDPAMGCAVNSTLPPGVGYKTLEVKMNFVRPLTASTGPVRCTGTVVHAGRTVATAEGRIVDLAGKLYAHGTSTLLVVHTAWTWPRGGARADRDAPSDGVDWPDGIALQARRGGVALAGHLGG